MIILNCGGIDHKFGECSIPKEPKESYKGKGGKEKGKGEGKGDWKGKKGEWTKGEWSKGDWKGGKGDKGGGKGGDKGGYKGKGKTDEIKTVVKSAIEAEKKAEKEEKEKTEKEEKEKAEKEKAEQLRFNTQVSRAIETEMVKALKSVGRAKMMKEVEKIQLNALREGKERACLDSGANRAARTMRDVEEMERAETVQVELANGTMATLKKNDRGTLLSETEIQTIIPLIPILHMGYKLKRRGDGFVLERGADVTQLHRDTGTLECKEE